MRAFFVLLAATLFSVSAMAATASQTTASQTTASQTTASNNLQIAANNQFAHTGTVVSAIDASIYTYIEVNENGKTIWIAAPTVAVKKGDTIGFEDGAPMANFFSKSLNRTFDVVYFVGKAAKIK